ncbi:Thioredoxin [Caulifigura coniformis]|uniref:Thioredoxin n=1 Tax=Caulifigura coniformis TaxID=2527983 RepID=A0A517SGQ2_9PLAN|nr:thioredoxin domain-containing protein [Caulifigura coniformis]QDT55302.1 Thioredoxin [Caulifigura coniformis]
MHRRHSLLLLLLFAAGCNSKSDFSTIAPPEDAWFAEEVTSQPMPVLVDFTASWCGPCKMIKPFLEKMKEEHAGKVKVVEIDVDARGDLAAHYKVSGYPTLVMIHGGNVVDICRGAPPSYEALMQWAGPHLK